MSKQFIKFILKILTLSILLVLSFNIGVNLINANSVIINNNENTSNNINFKKINNYSFGKTGVAISTNIGIRYTQKGQIPATIYKEVFSVSEIITNKENANNKIIGRNMQAVNEYKNVLQTDVKQLLDTSYDKPSILNAFIEQLEYRYTLGVENIKTLNSQILVFTNSMNIAITKIESLKIKIESDFQNNNSEESVENIEEYLKLKEEFYYSRTYIVYINHFLAEYTYLSNYNKVLLDTLINNKDALIKDSFVVIPDSSAGMLKRFNLIYTEEEFKQ